MLAPVSIRFFFFFFEDLFTFWHYKISQAYLVFMVYFLKQNKILNTQQLGFAYLE